MENVESRKLGRDGRIRGAEVKVGKSGVSIKRPINKLYPLVTNFDNHHTRIGCPNEMDAGTNPRSSDAISTIGISRPRRNAAVVGEIRRKKLTVDR